MKHVLITGMAGFIGSHLATRLDHLGYKVTGIDDFNGVCYDSTLKIHRRNYLQENTRVHLDECGLHNLRMFDFKPKPDLIIHLAAYVGVRHSMDKKKEYISNNILGTQHLIDYAESMGIDKVIYASTSCVMAGNELPWKEDLPTNLQLNPYGYSKRVNECQFTMSKIKSTIGLRFFTVYGPMGRPDMALWEFTNNILNSKPIVLFNNGVMKRDFTYIDDIIDGICLTVDRIFNQDVGDEIYNIGRGEQVDLHRFVAAIETSLGKEAIIEYGPKHPADTKETWSDTTKLKALGYNPKVSVEQGVEEFVRWYKQYHTITI